MCIKVFLVRMELLELFDNCIVWYVEEFWGLNILGDMYREIFFFKELLEYLVYRFDCEDIMYKIFEFDDCELM